MKREHLSFDVIWNSPNFICLKVWVLEYVFLSSMCLRSIMQNKMEKGEIWRIGILCLNYSYPAVPYFHSVEESILQFESCMKSAYAFGFSSAIFPRMPGITVHSLLNVSDIFFLSQLL